MSIANSEGYSKLIRYKVHHFAFWVAYFIFWFFFYHNDQQKLSSAFVNAFVTISVHGIAVYFNMYFLFNRLFKQKMYLSYVVSVILTVMLTTLIWALALNSASIITNHYPLEIWEIEFFTAGFASITYTIGISMSLKMVKQWYERERISENLERINMETELKYLKTQINPHFLFNSLNSLYALTLSKSDKAPELVLKLSEILRYVLYEGSEKWVSLDKEISYLRSYLDLEKIRNGDRLSLDFEVVGETAGKKIAPMLFLTFLENSFKHGINQKAEGGFVKIKMEVDSEQLHFKIQNSKPEEKEQRLNGKSGGIGINNIKKRLALLYPDKHDLNISDIGGSYMVDLKLNLRET